MPAIGTLSFTNDNGLDSGIAMLLTKPPKEKIDIVYRGCQLLADTGTPHVVCRFTGATSLSDAFIKGSILVQEVLDVLSMTGRADLVTRDAKDEHLLWWVSSGARSFALVSTTTSSLTLDTVNLTVQDAQGNIVTPPQVYPEHHIGFRFYRLSQTSDDLYDAYRNMYLAFESFLSSRYPKTKGLEIDWLRQSLTLASKDLSLHHLVPVGIVDPVSHVISVIYEGARLPLFHAKDGKAYFAPFQSAADREAVATALNVLTKIVICMASTWFSARRVSGWVNVDIIEKNHCTLFAESHFVFSDNPTFTLHDNLSSESITKGIPFPAAFSETHGPEIRHNITGTLPVSALASRGRLHALYLVNSKSPLISFSPDTTVDLNGFDAFQVYLFIRWRNASAPRYMYPR